MYALDDYNVLSLENGISAPLCSRVFGDLGAHVVKVERPEVGDVNRHWDGIVHGRSAAHAWVDRNKESIELDLKSDEGREVFLELAEQADVVIQNSSPGVVESLGVGYEDVRERNGEVIYLNISGYGRSGPYRDRKAYDLIMQGETGLIEMNGSPDAPAKIPLSICDVNAAMWGTIGVLTSLLHRERTGEGQELDVSMFGGMLSWLGYFPFKYWYTGEVPERVGFRHHLLVPYGPYETASDEYISFAVLSDAHWEIFCEDVIDESELLTDERFQSNEDRLGNREELEPVIESIIASEPTEFWSERLDDAGLPWGHVNDVGETLEHPQTEHLGMIGEMETEDGDIKYIENPIDFETLESRAEPMPKLGEHSEAILDALGYTDAQIEQLREQNVI
ncbi:CaiB/BaiF CoA transferase family protein [Natronorubrum sp. FCH18a]|uniref:CaiB/BaiF CoA transferase family protein n=1 Tax=Natronorubrum sp. FCH18a TaxID=3447018 RepID=UPI003F519C15